MAGEQAYINPIIEAMANHARTMQENRRMALLTQAQKDKVDQENQDRKIRQQTADQAEQQIKDLKEHNQAMVDVARDREKTYHEEGALNVSKFIRENLAGGGSFPKASDITVPSTPGAPAMTIPGTGQQFMGQHIDPSQYPGPEQLNKQALDQYKAKVGVDEKTKLNEMAQQHTQRMTELAATGENQEKVAKIHGGFMTQVARINHELESDQSGSAGLVNNLADSLLSGQRSYTSLSKDEKKAVDTLGAQRGWQFPSDQKDYNKKLEAVGNVQALMDQYREMALNYSKDSPGNTSNMISRFAHGQLGGLITTSDLNAKLDALKATGGTLATYFDQQNRKSDAEIIRQVKGAFDPTATVAENLDKLKGKTDLINGSVRRTFSGMAPDQINYILGARGIKDFGGFGKEAEKTSNAPGNLPIGTRPTGIPQAPSLSTPSIPNPSIHSIVRDPKTGELTLQ